MYYMPNNFLPQLILQLTYIILENESRVKFKKKKRARRSTKVCTQDKMRSRLQWTTSNKSMYVVTPSLALQPLTTEMQVQTIYIN